MGRVSVNGMPLRVDPWKSSGIEQKQPSTVGTENCRCRCCQGHRGEIDILRIEHIKEHERLFRGYHNDLAKEVSRFNQLIGEYNSLRKRFESLKNGLEDEKFLYKYSGQFRSLADANLELSNTVAANQSTIKQLQRDLATIRHGHGPVHDEQYYRDELSSLHRKMENWVNKFTRPPLTTQWTDDQSAAFLALLFTTGTAGEAASEELRKHQFLSSLPSPRAQRVLFRHVLAVYLFDAIFDSFAVAMDKSASNTLSELELSMFENACASGTLFTVWMLII